MTRANVSIARWRRGGGEQSEERQTLPRRVRPDLLLLGELDDATAALRLLGELRSGDALASRIDPAMPVILLTPDEGEWAALRALEAGAVPC